MNVELARDIHASNIAAGWWPPVGRNRPEILMLIVSEVAEASEGHLRDLPDDKLPHLLMFSVELADTAIRLYDVIGADAVDHVPAFGVLRTLAISNLDRTRSVDEELMTIVRCVANAMEHHRKRRLDDYGYALWLALAHVYVVAEMRAVPLDDIIAQKRAFNAVRPDHKLEARMAEGGKAY